MSRAPPNQPGFRPSEALNIQRDIAPRLNQLNDMTNAQNDQQILNTVNGMSNQQRAQTVQEFLERQTRYYTFGIFQEAESQQKTLGPQIDQLRTIEWRRPDIQTGNLATKQSAEHIELIFSRLRTIPTPVRDAQDNVTQLNPPPPQTYFTTNIQGLVTEAITGRVKGAIINAPLAKDDIDFLDSLKGEATPAQGEFLESLKQKLIAYSIALDARNMEQWLRPQSQVDQAVGKFGRIAVFLALSVGAIVNGLISLRNKSSPTAALLMAGGAFFVANPDFLSPKDQQDLNDANFARARLQGLVNTYDIQGPAWIGILNRFINEDSFYPSPALQEFINKQPGPASNLALGSSIINLDYEKKKGLFTEFVNAPPRGADDRIDREALTNPIDKHLYDMIIARPREFYTLVTTLSGLQGEARKFALTSIQLGAWQQQPQVPPQPQLPPNVA